MTILSRLSKVTLQILISVDQSAAIIISTPIYMIFGGPCPNADETISSIVGRNAQQGKLWARICGKFIDTIFGALGQKNHCRKSIEIFSSREFKD